MAMQPCEISLVSQFEDELLKLPQEEIETDHVIHAGIYTRTVKLKAECAMTGALIKIPTTLILSGDVTVYIGGESVRLTGHHAIAAQAGRKQAFVAHADTYITMSFATKAQTVAEAEQEFTDDYERLMSRNGINKVQIGDLV